jgi:hypothetical protein
MLIPTFLLHLVSARPTQQSPFYFKGLDRMNKLRRFLPKRLGSVARRIMQSFGTHCFIVAQGLRSMFIQGRVCVAARVDASIASCSSAPKAYP